MEHGAWIIDVSDGDFEREVLERSRSVPVVVDFWAPWCGPCRTLGPVLERLADQGKGSFVLAKVNIDQSPRVAQAFGVQSIPFVIGFRDGVAAAEFVGAQPESVVARFIASLMPSEADRLAAEGQALLAGGDRETAEQRFRAAIVQEGHHVPASLGLARLLAEAGRAEEALSILESLEAGASGQDGKELEALLASLRLARGATASESALRERIAAEPADLRARLDLGRLLAAQQRYQEALEALLDVVACEPGFADGEARKSMLDIFALLGRDSPLTDRYQRELARVLFR